jgi:hypothetical protein
VLHNEGKGGERGVEGALNQKYNEVFTDFNFQMMGGGTLYKLQPCAGDTNIFGCRFLRLDWRKYENKQPNSTEDSHSANLKRAGRILTVPPATFAHLHNQAKPNKNPNIHS